MVFIKCFQHSIFCIYSILLIIPRWTLHVTHYSQNDHLYLGDMYIHVFTHPLIGHLLVYFFVLGSLLGIGFVVINQTE